MLVSVPPERSILEELQAVVCYKFIIESSEHSLLHYQSSCLLDSRLPHSKMTRTSTAALMILQYLVMLILLLLLKTMKNFYLAEMRKKPQKESAVEVYW